MRSSIFLADMFVLGLDEEVVDGDEGTRAIVAYFRLFGVSFLESFKLPELSFRKLFSIELLLLLLRFKRPHLFLLQKKRFH